MFSWSLVISLTFASMFCVSLVFFIHFPTVNVNSHFIRRLWSRLGAPKPLCLFSNPSTNKGGYVRLMIKTKLAHTNQLVNKQKLSGAQTLKRYSISDHRCVTLRRLLSNRLHNLPPSLFAAPAEATQLAPDLTPLTLTQILTQASRCERALGLLHHCIRLHMLS